MVARPGGARPPAAPGRAAGRAAVAASREATAARLAEEHPRDGDAWLALCRQWDTVGDAVLRTLFTTFPPVRGPAALLRAVGTAEALRLARFLLLPAKRMGEELFAGEGARLLLAGNAAHADAPVDAPVSGAYGWLLAMIGQQHGFPVPVGGSGELAAALSRRARSAGAAVHCDQPVERIDVRGGRAVAVHTSAGLTVRARRAVIADVNAPLLYRDLLPADAVPARLRSDLDRFEWDTPVVKVNWALDGPIPWRADGVAGAGTVHLGADELGLVRWSADLESRTIPASPFMLFGQMTTADPSRSPAGTQSAWAYTHLPRGIDDDASADELARRVDATVEEFAPGFGARVVHRQVQRPSDISGDGPEPRDRRGERRHGAAVPAAGVPPGAGAGPRRDRRRQPLPRQLVGAPRRRGARHLRRPRGPRGAARPRPAGLRPPPRRRRRPRPGSTATDVHPHRHVRGERMCDSGHSPREVTFAVQNVPTRR